MSYLILSYLILSYPILSCLILSYPVLSCLILSYPVLSSLILSYPTLSCLILPYPVLSCLILSYPVLSCLILPYPALSCLIMSYPILSCLILSYPCLSCPILSYPVLSYLSIHPFIHPSIHLSIYLSICVRAFISHSNLTGARLLVILVIHFLLHFIVFLHFHTQSPGWFQVVMLLRSFRTALAWRIRFSREEIQQEDGSSGIRPWWGVPMFSLQLEVSSVTWLIQSPPWAEIGRAFGQP